MYSYRCRYCDSEIISVRYRAWCDECKKTGKKGLIPEQKQKRYRTTKNHTRIKTDVPPVGSFFIDHERCYLAEAAAMLEGKHWKGKNKCVKLPGDREADQGEEA